MQPVPATAVRSLRRERMALAVRSGSSGADRRRRHAQLVESWLAGVWSQATAQLPAPAAGVALAAVGGVARRDAGPAGDLDLMLLHDGRALPPAALADLADRLWYPVWDAGVRLDHSVRSVAQCRQVATGDLVAGVGLLDLRVLCGDAALVARTRAALLADWRGAARRRLPDLLAAGEERAARHGDLAQLLEPDLKESRGGLRDITVLHALSASWLADRPHGEVDHARAVLLDVRDALHAVTGRPGNRLHLQDQDAVAAAVGAGDADDLLAQVSQAARTVAHALATTSRRARQAMPRRRARGARRPQLHPLGGGLAVHDGEVVLGGGVRVGQDPVLALQAAAAAARAGLPLGAVTVAHLAADSPQLPVPWPRAAREAFLELLGAGPGTVAVWESLDMGGLVVRWLPAWQGIRNRPQRTAVHRHTVDRHSLEVVVAATAFARDVQRPDLLLLAALCHDLGKLPGAADHARVGAPPARELCLRIGMPERDADVVTTLVRQHLALVELATRRDPDDPRTVQTLVEAVGGDGGVLTLLRALTEADARAAGPAAWTPWRARLVDALVARARLALSGSVPPGPAPLTAQERCLLDAARADRSPHVVITSTEAATSTSAGLAVTVVAPDRVGLVTQVAAVLAASRLSVRSALVRTVDGIAVVTWQVVPAGGEVPQAALLRTALRRLAGGDDSLRREVLRREQAWRGATPGAPGAHRGPAGSGPDDPRVVVLPGASQVATVLEVRAPDRPTLLLALSEAVTDLGVDIRSAHVATYAGHAVDVLYLAEPGGGPLAPPRVATVVAALVDVAG